MSAASIPVLKPTEASQLTWYQCVRTDCGAVERMISASWPWKAESNHEARPVISRVTGIVSSISKVICR